MVWQWFTGAEFETAKHSRLSDHQESDGDMDAQQCRVKTSGRGRDPGEAGMPESTCEGIPKEKPVVGNQARDRSLKGQELSITYCMVASTLELYLGPRHELQ